MCVCIYIYTSFCDCFASRACSHGGVRVYICVCVGPLEAFGYTRTMLLGELVYFAISRFYFVLYNVHAHVWFDFAGRCML